MYTEKKRLENISFNASMMDADTSVLPERVVAQLSAIEEVHEVYKSQLAEGEQLPHEFDQAIQYAVRFLYRTGNPAYGPSLRRQLEIDLGYQKNKSQEDEWLPSNEVDMLLVQNAAEVASSLGEKDNIPAFQPNRNGDRENVELMDPYDAWYNKYGFLLRGTQQYGSYQ